jgi:cytochrome P450
MRPGGDSIQSSGTEIAVKVKLMRELGSRHAEYRQAMSTPLDPTSVLALTGQVLETVNHILTSSEQTHGLCPNIRGSGND